MRLCLLVYPCTLVSASTKSIVVEFCTGVYSIIYQVHLYGSYYYNSLILLEVQTELY